MEKKEYISGDLYKMTRNNAEFKPQEVAEKSVTASAAVQDNSVSKAQMRRLSDVYNAKLDLAARMERSLQKLTTLNDELELLIEKRKKAAGFLNGKIAELEKLTEPDGGRELHEYLRNVEHLRMDYFRKEAEIEMLLNNNGKNSRNSSFWKDLNEMKAGHLMKLSFCGMFPLIITILTSAVIVALAVISAMKI